MRIQAARENDPVARDRHSGGGKSWAGREGEGGNWHQLTKSMTPADHAAQGGGHPFGSGEGLGQVDTKGGIRCILLVSVTMQARSSPALLKGLCTHVDIRDSREGLQGDKLCGEGITDLAEHLPGTRRIFGLQVVSKACKDDIAPGFQIMPYIG